MFNFDYITKEDIKEHNSDHPYRISIVRGSGSEKTNVLLTLTNNEPDIDNLFIFKRSRLLINKRESTGFKYLNDSKAFIEYSNDMYKTLKTITQIKN